LRQIPAVRNPAFRNTSAATWASAGSRSSKRVTPECCGFKAVQSEAIEHLVHDD
jgi:hypothetical protein